MYECPRIRQRNADAQDTEIIPKTSDPTRGDAGGDDKKDPLPKHAAFDEATIAAWSKRGFEAGWLGLRELGRLQFETEREELVAPVPAFRPKFTAIERAVDDSNPTDACRTQYSSAINGTDRSLMSPKSGTAATSFWSGCGGFSGQQDTA